MTKNNKNRTFGTIVPRAIPIPDREALQEKMYEAYSKHHNIALESTRRLFDDAARRIREQIKIEMEITTRSMLFGIDDDDR